jgi:hypothetical protein
VVSSRLPSEQQSAFDSETLGLALGVNWSVPMPSTIDAIRALHAADLTAVNGGRLRLPKGNGSGPQHPMELLDKPQKTWQMFKDAIGIQPSGKPGDNYFPPSANPDGSVNPGRFETPRDPNAPTVPMSQ